MDIKQAKSAGFCFGVKRAVDTVYKEIKNNPEGRKICTYGPIIHNDEVVKDLEKNGVCVVSNLDELDRCSNGVLVIRSHGVGKDIYQEIEKRNIKIIDATCPFVKKIHKIVERESLLGKSIIIIGDKNHPEVVGIKGWAMNDIYIIGSKEEAKMFSEDITKGYCIVAQTTFNGNKFKDLVEIIREKGYDIFDLNTICSATSTRQEEAREISGQVDAMIVIGDKKSSNTSKLYEICKERCEDTYYIQTPDDLDLCNLQSAGSVGITAGASTPNYIIEEVHKNVRTKF